MAAHDQGSLARRGEHLQSITLAFLASSWFFIALRTWTRTYIISQFGWDDATMAFAGVIFTVYCACILYIENNGGGTHITSVAQLTVLTKWVIASEVTYILTVLVLKISLGIFFARIIVKNWQLHLINATLIVTALSSVSAIFYCVFRCGANVDDYVLRQLADKCTSKALDRFFAYQQASFSFMSDCIFVTLPTMILWNVHMERKWKIYVGFILSFAALGCFCSAVRFRYVEGLTQVEDFFWNVTNISVWSTIEPGVVIVAGCLATLRPLLNWFRTRAQSLRSSNSEGGQPTLHSTRSAKVISKQKSSSGCDNRPCTLIHQDVEADAYNNESIELMCVSGKREGSTECILVPQKQASDTLESSEPNRGVA